MREQVDCEVVQSPGKGRMVRELLVMGNRKRLVVGMMIMLAQNLTGIFAFSSFHWVLEIKKANVGVVGRYQRSELLLRNPHLSFSFSQSTNS